MADRVVHFEIPVDEPERAYRFYQAAFGWTVTAMPEMQYAMAVTAPTDENGMPSEPGAINGGMMRRQEPTTGPVITIGVDDLDRALENVEQLGGKVVRGRFEVGSMGAGAYFADPEGNVVGLWQSTG